MILGVGGVENGGVCLSVVEVIATDDDRLKNSGLYQRSATRSGRATGTRVATFISNKAILLHSIDN